jgi:hypothetical protein
MLAKEFLALMPTLRHELKCIEEQLVTLQQRYEEASHQLQHIDGLLKQLKSRGVPLQAPITWIRVCHLKGWEVGNTPPHRYVKRHDPALHALLHQCAINNYCTLDKVQYVR